MSEALLYWECLSCGVVNFPGALNCYRCCAAPVVAIDWSKGAEEAGPVLTNMMGPQEDFTAMFSAVRAQRDQTLSRDEHDRLTGLLEKYDKG